MTFRFDKLTTKAQALVAEAQGRAASAGNPEINTLHLLGAMLDEPDGITRPLLEKMSVDVKQLHDSGLQRTGQTAQGLRRQAGRYRPRFASDL